MKYRKSGAVTIFVGLLLIAVCVIGIVNERNPGTFVRKYRYDMALEMFVSFCSSVWLPAGIIGVPLFLVSLILSLIRERKENRQ